MFKTISKTAVYPACATDFDVPAQLLAPIVDSIVFVDHSHLDETAFQRTQERFENVKLEYVQGDAREVLNDLTRIDVVFHRRDSFDGSGITVLRKSFLRRTLLRMPREGGLFITDGSCLWQNEFRRLKRSTGVLRYGWHLKAEPSEQFARFELVPIRATPERPRRHFPRSRAL